MEIRSISSIPVNRTAASINGAAAATGQSEPTAGTSANNATGTGVSAAGYISPFLRYDQSARVAVLYFRDVDTGETQSQIPSAKVVEEYRRAAGRLSTKDETLTAGGTSDRSAGDTAGGTGDTGATASGAASGAASGSGYAYGSTGTGSGTSGTAIGFGVSTASGTGSGAGSGSTGADTTSTTAGTGFAAAGSTGSAGGGFYGTGSGGLVSVTV